jgi:hypothetical protein
MDGSEHGEGFAARWQERRAHPRYSVDEDSLLVFVNHGMPLKARLVELSLEGCRVRTCERFTGKAGRPVEITFKVKGFAFRFSGVVEWSCGHHLVGIHFVNMIPRRKIELAEVVEEMAAAAAARARAVNQLVAEQEAAAPAPPMIPEAVAAETLAPGTAKASESAVAARPVEPPAVARETETPALVPEMKPPVEVQAGGTEAAAELEPPVQGPAMPRDRRGQMRHEVDTFATIFLVKVGSALRGRILDLSLSGCRIRTDERFPVGIYTRVETEFHLQGLPFRLGGVIQAIHDRDTVGIRFLDLSERKRQQVLDLIGEIEQMRAAMLHAESLSAQTDPPTDGR